MTIIEGIRIDIRAGPDVTEGETAVFTFAADPAPRQDTTVNFRVQDNSVQGSDGDFLDPGEEGVQSLVIPAGQASATHRIPTADDGAWEKSGTLVVSLEPGNGYIYDESNGVELARLWVLDNDPRPPPDVTMTLSANGGVVGEGTPSTRAAASS